MLALGAGASTVASRVRTCWPTTGRTRGHSALPRPQEHHPHRALHKLGARSVQNVLARLRIEARGHLSRYDADFGSIKHSCPPRVCRVAAVRGRREEADLVREWLECLDCNDVVSRKRPRSRSSILGPPRRSGFLPCRLISGVSARHSCGNGFIAPLQRFGDDLEIPAAQAIVCVPVEWLQRNRSIQLHHSEPNLAPAWDARNSLVAFVMAFARGVDKLDNDSLDTTWRLAQTFTHL